VKLPKNWAALLLTLVAAVCFIGISTLPNDPVNYTVRFTLGMACIATVWRWGRAAARVYWQGAKDPEDSVILGVCGFSIALLWYCAVSSLSIAYDSPDWITNSPLRLVFPFLCLTALLLSIASTLRNEPPGAVLGFLITMASGIMLVATGLLHAVIAKIGPIVSALARLLPH
jgi:hypothetical protein